MIENVLVNKNFSLKARITVKGVIAALTVALAVLLPQLVHIAAGASGGMTYLPMYLPVLLGGCLLGFRWGLGVGIASPLVSFAITSAMGSAMPAAARLPYMIAELVVWAAVSGLFSKKITENAWVAFPAVLIAAVSGRAVFVALAAIFSAVSPLDAATAWAQVQSGFIGLIAQAIVVPFIVIGLRALLVKNDGRA